MMTLIDSKMSLVVALLCVSCTGVAGFLRRGDGDELADCSCDCCNAVRRLPEESASGVKVKCAPSHDHGSDVCTNECKPSTGDRLLSTRANVLDYQRYCFYECKPAEGPSAPVSSQCIALDFKDIQKTEDTLNGQARDPALIYQAPVHKAALVSAKRADPTPTPQDWKEGQSNAVGLAKAESLRGLKQSAFEGNEAFQEAKVTRGIEAKTAQSMNEMLRDHLESDSDDAPAAFGAKDPFAGIHDIRQLTVNAGAAAEKAGEAAQAALAALKKARAITWSNAVDQAERAMQDVKAQAEAKAKVDAEHLKRITNTLEIKMAAAAAKAAEPFFISMLRAQQTSKEYKAKAEENAEQARDLEAQSQKFGKEANEDNAAGKAAIAQTNILEARRIMREAQAFAKQARHFFAVSKEIDKGIPKFAAAAQAASAKAAYDLNPAWQR